MNRKIAFPSLFLFLSVLSFSCKENTVAPSGPTMTLDDAYSIAAQDANLRCLIVYKDDHIIKERYFHQGDSSSAHDVRSVTKSVMATLMGIAIDQQKIGDYLRPLVSTIYSVKANIKICDLLSMSSGLSGNDIPDVTEYNNWFNAPNQLQYTLNKSMIG
jgi:CubicO group peptidase (beta-lactamase class C family)